MRPEGTYGPPGEPEMTSAAALRGHEATAAACLRQVTANFERGIRAFKIHVFPLEGQELALPQAGGDGQYVESLHSVPLDRIEEHPHLIPREGPHLLSAGLWRFHGRATPYGVTEGAQQATQERHRVSLRVRLHSTDYLARQAVASGIIKLRPLRFRHLQA